MNLWRGIVIGLLIEAAFILGVWAGVWLAIEAAR